MLELDIVLLQESKPNLKIMINEPKQALMVIATIYVCRMQNFEFVKAQETHYAMFCVVRMS